jgi:DNA-binding transcriptional ArsR family regulator
MRDPRRFTAYIDVLLALDEIWGDHMVALELARAHLEGYGVTIDSLSARIGMSHDTAQRRLDRLVTEAKVWLSAEDGRRVYRPVAEYAEQTVEITARAERYHPQSA